MRESVLFPTRMGPSTAMYRGLSKRLAMVSGRRTAEYLDRAIEAIERRVNSVDFRIAIANGRFGISHFRPGVEEASSREHQKNSSHRLESRHAWGTCRRGYRGIAGCSGLPVDGADRAVVRAHVRGVNAWSPADCTHLR